MRERGREAERQRGREGERERGREGERERGREGHELVLSKFVRFVFEKASTF